MPSNAVSFFASFIEKELGIIYSEFNHFQLQNRLEEIAKMRALRDVDELWGLAQKSMPADLKQLILDVATNNETSFFRDTKLFQSLKLNLIPEIFSVKRSEPISIWSAACSTGQEPYSLLMLIENFKEKVNGSANYKIVASDISSRVLERARKARYSQLEVQRGMPANLLIKYFDKDPEDYWTLKSAWQNRIQFEKRNLLESFNQLGKFDIIFCRNVLIYQNVENKKKIIRKIISCMDPASYLILGAGESMIGLSESFDTVKVGETIIYRLKQSVNVNAV